MNTTAQERKTKAIQLLKQLDIYEPYINGYEENDQEPEIEAKMKEIEQEHNCTVYAITHEFTDFGECYDFLIVTDYPDEWETLMHSNRNDHYAFAYVWNKTDDWCSEFGTVALQSFCGGIKRIG